jgi:ubiquinone/menaquinone biosynthesis C-methylase UbiE
VKPHQTEPDWRQQILETQRGQAETVSRYNKIAPLYEFWARLTETKARHRLLQLARPQDGNRVLEVATGTGVQLSALARRNPSGLTVGLELAERMVIETRNRISADHLARIPIVRADALRMPFEDQSFDLVTNSYMLDLLPRELIPRALMEFSRVLRPGGRLVLVNMTKGERPWHRGWDMLYRLGVPLTGNCRGVLAVPVLRELRFEDIEREYIAQMSFPTEVVTARKPLRP